MVSMRECTQHLADASRQLAAAKEQNRRLSANKLENMNMQGELQRCRNEVMALERKVADLQAQAAMRQVAVVESVGEAAAPNKVAAARDAEMAAVDKAAAGMDEKEAKGALEMAGDVVSDAGDAVAAAASTAADQAKDLLSGAMSAITGAATDESEAVKEEAAGEVARDKAEVVKALQGGRSRRARKSRRMRR